MTANPGTVEVGGLRCSLVRIPELVERVGAALAGDRDDPRPLSVLCVNAHVFNLAWDDADLRARLNAADLLALDGMSMVWASRRAGGGEVERCNMTEALRAFVTSSRVPARRALLIGLDAASAERAGAALDALDGAVRVADVLDGYRDLDAYRDAVAGGDHDLVLVGCGTPRSEAIVEALVETGGPAVVWHVGGGTLHFLAGNQVEAPAWMRRTGTQWVHRLATQPGQMWRRYLVGNPRFALRVLRGGAPPR